MFPHMWITVQVHVAQGLGCLDRALSTFFSTILAGVGFLDRVTSRVLPPLGLLVNRTGLPCRN